MNRFLDIFLSITNSRSNSSDPLFYDNLEFLAEKTTNGVYAIFRSINIILNTEFSVRKEIYFIDTVLT